jgi:hypothetical protein
MIFREETSLCEETLQGGTRERNISNRARIMRIEI